MPFLGRPLIQQVLERLTPLADEVLLVTGRPADYHFLGLEAYPDLIPGRGPLGGLFTALSMASQPLVALVGCDMPFANLDIFRYACTRLQSSSDAAIPTTGKGLEPLHAVYRRESCLPLVQQALEAGEMKLIAWLGQARVEILTPQQVAGFDPRQLAFYNLNTPEEFRQAEELAGAGSG